MCSERLAASIRNDHPDLFDPGNCVERLRIVLPGRNRPHRRTPRVKQGKNHLLERGIFAKRGGILPGMDDCTALRRIRTGLPHGGNGPDRVSGSGRAHRAADKYARPHGIWNLDHKTPPVI
jgi:hypothetical protein